MISFSEFYAFHKEKIIDAVIASIPALLVAAFVYLSNYLKERKKTIRNEKKKRDDRISHLKSQIIFICEQLINYVSYNEIYVIRTSIAQIYHHLSPTEYSITLYSLYSSKADEYEGLWNLHRAELRKNIWDLFLYLSQPEIDFLELKLNELTTYTMREYEIDFTKDLTQQIEVLKQEIAKVSDRIYTESFGKPLYEIMMFMNPKVYKIEINKSINMEQSNNENEKKELREYVSKTFFHELDRVASRTDWFLIFHAILFEAFFACKESIKVGAGDNDIPLAIVGFIGILTSYIWLMNGIRSWITLAQVGLYMGDSKIMGNGKPININSPQNVAEMHNKIFRERNKSYFKRTMSGWARDLPAFAVVVPFLFISAWEILTGCYLCWWFIPISIFPMVLISIITRWIGPGPGLRKETM
jgi:hypothetical protein